MMPNEKQIRALARNALEAGTLPWHDPDRTWGGPGVGLPCAVCGDRIPAGQMEYEVQFGHDGETPSPDRFHLHLPCFAAWEEERTEPRN